MGKTASIIIDNYNYGRFVGDAIDSALAQNEPGALDVEVIVVDDGSTDESRAVMARYGNRIISVFKENGGQSSAVNAGFAQATGELIIFLDADDMLVPGIVRRVCEAMRTNPRIAKVQYRMQVVDREGVKFGDTKPHAHLPLPNGDLRGHFLHFPGDVIWLPMSGNAYPAWVLRRILPIPEQDFRILADMYLCNLAPLFGDLCTLPEVGASYRLHGSNNHELIDEDVHLPQIRSLIMHWQKVFVRTLVFATELGLPNRPASADHISSMTDVALRMISLKLEPENHPRKDDRIGDLLLQGLDITRRRFNIGPVARIISALWLTALALSPRQLAYKLSHQWMFPQARPLFINAMLGRMYSAELPTRSDKFKIPKGVIVHEHVV